MADNGPTLNAGLVTVIFDRIRTIIAMKSYIFVIFQLEVGVVVRTHCPTSSRSAHGVPTVVQAKMAKITAEG